VTKDRPGHVREHAGDQDRVADMRLSSDPETGAVTIALNPPEAGDAAPWRPTHLMERISQAVELQPGMSKREIRDLKGKSDALDQALRILISEGFIESQQDGRSVRHTSVCPYREGDDEN
jgi:hypothetical protein